MQEDLNEPVSVTTFYDSGRGTFRPEQVIWRGRQYIVSKIGLHHSFWKGRFLVHVFSVVCGDNFVRLRLETDKLRWFIDSFGY